MSELLNNSNKRKDLLKHMILQLHKGEAPEDVKIQLTRLLGQIPYNEVVEVEQQLIADGLPQEEVLKLCDVHTAALKGVIDQSGAKEVPPGHPVDTFRQENRALEKEIRTVADLFERLRKSVADTEKDKLSDEAINILLEIMAQFNLLMDVEKHYMRKENLLFPYLEKKDVTGPPTVMWGKHDETRELLKNSLEALSAGAEISASEISTMIELVLQPAITAVEEMIYKEEEILFPMCLDKLNDSEWYEIYSQSMEIGFCLYDPQTPWQPDGIEAPVESSAEQGKIKLPSGSMNTQELNAILNTIPFDMTFVDAEDRVRYFTQGQERIFARSRAILGRKVQQCHPPKSMHVVEQILNDFKAGKQDQAAFWIQMGGKFIHIEYFAMRGENKEYLGTLEVSQDLTEKRNLDGEQRLLSYAE